MKRVVKFGGSSLASARQFRKVVDAIKSDKSRRYVVPPAPDRRNGKNEKVADLFYTCYDAVAGGRSYRKILGKIKSRYIDIVDGLDLNLNLGHESDRIGENFLAKVGRDYAASRREYLNGIVAADFLGFEFVDAAEIISFDKGGNFESEHTNRELSERLGHVEKAVIPSFYGSKPDGIIKTSPKDSSGVMGSTVAKVIHMDIYENWTDVPGALVADPRIVENPEVIETITYKEPRELSCTGANALHEDAIFPVRKEGIPVNIRNTNRPEDKDTLIVGSTCHRLRYTITGIAGKGGFCSISIEKAMMSAEVGFGRKVLSVFEQYGISFEHMPSGIDAMTVYVYQSGFEEFEQSVIAGIYRAMELGTMELESGLALIAVVGQGMRSTRETAGRVLPVPTYAGVSMKVIDQGSNEWNIIIGVENDDFETAVRVIYDIFVIAEL